MAPEDKIHLFEHMLTQFIRWQWELTGRSSEKSFNEANNFSKIKAIKLHFFTIAVNADKDSLLVIFNELLATAYGHVEKFIYESITNDVYDLTYYKWVDGTLKFKDDVKLSEITPNKNLISEIQEIDTAIEQLRIYNNKLVTYNSLDLVNLSLDWISWKSAYAMARDESKFSQAIPNDVIKKEEKFFTLSNL